MDEKEIRKYVGKKCLVSLKNGMTYTAVIPNFFNDTITVIDKYDEEVSFICEFVAYITPLKEENKKEENENGRGEDK